MIRKMNNVTKKFEDLFWSSSSLEDLYTNTESKNDNPMIAIFNKSMIEWLKLRNSKIKDRIENRLNNVLVSSINNEITKLEKNMIFLASLGSSAPFVGLFGTVWGIMNSFQAIGITKNTSLAVVAPGIAEALFATALGLIAAIPAVIAYNKISSVFDNYSIRLETFAQEFVNRVTK
jgi:biopolymer transport protein TolQ